MSATIIPPDPAHDVFRSEHQPLNAIFAPSSVAVIGATATHHSVGLTQLERKSFM